MDINIQSQQFIINSIAGLPEQGGRGGVSLSKVFCECAFFVDEPLNVLFLKEVTKNVHGNQQAKLRVS